VSTSRGLPVACVLLAVAVTSVSLAGAGPASTVVKGFASPKIDGAIGANEWDGAAKFAFSAALPPRAGGGTVPATLYVANDARNLYFAIRAERPQLGLFQSMSISIDNDGDGLAEAGDDRLQVYYANATREVYAGDYFITATGLQGFDDRNGGTSDISGAIDTDASSTTFELSHPLDSADDAHDLSIGTRGRLKFAVFLCLGEPETTNCTYTSWPPTPGEFADLVVAGGPVTLDVSSAQFEAGWNESVVSGSLVVAGTTGDGADLTVAATPAAGAPATFAFSVPSGPFSQRLEVPHELLPGTYSVAVEGTSDGVALPAQRKNAVLAAPPEGVVRETSFRASQSGEPVTALPAGAREIWASFRFAVMPKRTTCTTKTIVVKVTVVRGKKRVKRKKVKTCTASISVVWYAPGSASPLVTVQKKEAQVIESFARSQAGLASGTWRVVLRVGGRVTKQATIQVG
jgi:hypothetical protein